MHTLLKAAAVVISATVVGLSIWLGRQLLIWQADSTTVAAIGAWTQWVQLLIGLAATLVAGTGAYRAFFTPFTPRVSVGAYTWRIRPIGSPNAPVEIALWISITNVGARPGEIRDFAAVVSLPKGQWVMSPMFYANSTEYLESLMRPKDSPEIAASEPFSPLYLSGNRQALKCVLFVPFEGRADLSFIEPGTHQVDFYIQYEAPHLEKIASRKIIFEPNIVQEWQGGTTVSGAQFERSTPVDNLLPITHPEANSRKAG